MRFALAGFKLHLHAPSIRTKSPRFLQTDRFENTYPSNDSWKQIVVHPNDIHFNFDERDLKWLSNLSGDKFYPDGILAPIHDRPMRSVCLTVRAYLRRAGRLVPLMCGSCFHSPSPIGATLYICTISFICFLCHFWRSGLAYLLPSYEHVTQKSLVKWGCVDNYRLHSHSPRMYTRNSWFCHIHVPKSIFWDPPKISL